MRSIEVEKVSVPTLYLAGDSTVVDQDKEPWAAWGQMLPVLLWSRGSAVANQAESGRDDQELCGGEAAGEGDVDDEEGATT